MTNDIILAVRSRAAQKAAAQKAAAQKAAAKKKAPAKKEAPAKKSRRTWRGPLNKSGHGRGMTAATQKTLRANAAAATASRQAAKGGSTGTLLGSVVTKGSFKIKAGPYKGTKYQQIAMCSDHNPVTKKKGEHLLVFQPKPLMSILGTGMNQAMSTLESMGGTFVTGPGSSKMTATGLQDVRVNEDTGKLELVRRGCPKKGAAPIEKSKVQYQVWSFPGLKPKLKDYSAFDLNHSR